MRRQPVSRVQFYIQYEEQRIMLEGEAEDVVQYEL